tara:strand:- start:49 stop:534 length:486 start_codon:yes stop_codon:yes gene_type:complete
MRVLAVALFAALGEAARPHAVDKVLSNCEIQEKMKNNKKKAEQKLDNKKKYNRNICYRNRNLYKSRFPGKRQFFKFLHILPKIQNCLFVQNVFVFIHFGLISILRFCFQHQIEEAANPLGAVANHPLVGAAQDAYGKATAKKPKSSQPAAEPTKAKVTSKQ